MKVQWMIPEGAKIVFITLIRAVEDFASLCLISLDFFFFSA